QHGCRRRGRGAHMLRPVNLGLGEATTAAMARGTQDPHIRSGEDICRGMALQRTRGPMHASASTKAFRRWPSSEVSELVQFHPEPQLDMTRTVRNPDADTPFFEKRTEAGRAAATEVSFGRFRLFPTQFLLLEGDEPAPLGSRALEILMILLERPGK